MSAPTPTVLLVGALAPVRTALLEAVPQLVEGGARVYLGAYRLAATDHAGVPLLQARRMQPSLFPQGARRFSPRWLVGLMRYVLMRLIEKFGDPPLRVWTQARRDKWLLARAAEADVIVALDQSAAWTVWNLAQSNKHAAVVYGLPAAIDAVHALVAA